MNIHELLAIPASGFPEVEHVRCGDIGLTYAQSLEIVERTATQLEGLGVTRGGTVAYLGVNSPSYALMPFATALVGATFVPLNYRVKRLELMHMLNTAHPQVLLVSSRYEALAREALAAMEREIALVTIDNGGLGEASHRAPSEGSSFGASSAGEAVDPAVLMFTSGTTALPKAVELTHEQLTTYVLSTATLPEQPRGATLLAVPLYHIAGLGALLASTFGVRRVVLLPQFDPGEWLAAISRDRITHAFLVPTMLKRVMEHPAFSSADLSSIEVLSYGSAPMPFSVIERAITVFPHSVGFVNAYGQTETTSTITMLLPEDHRMEGTPDQIERRKRRLSSVGRALPDVEIAILGPDGTVLPPGQVGDVGARSARLMRQYRTEIGTSEAQQVGGWLITRDLGYVDEDGYLFLTGRQGDFIIRGGENIAPEEVRSALLLHPAVEDAAVIGIPDEEWGQIVSAVVVLRSGLSVSPRELIDHCRQHLASYKKPDVIRIVDELPRNAMGKVVTRDLAEIVLRPNGEDGQGASSSETSQSHDRVQEPASVIAQRRFVGPRLERIAPAYAKRAQR